ncbi:MAG TPA: lipoyl synthase [Chloroflexota bacterium]|nr:lipoyl synthase [Chloroflexota bacterium]
METEAEPVVPAQGQLAASAEGVRKPPIRIGLGTERIVTKPDWLKVRWNQSQTFLALEAQLREHHLHTVCEEALCPNRGECWARGVATVLIMGDICTRRCGFCAIGKGRPAPLDPDEPRRMAETAALLGARYLVITSVDRDDLPDGGAAHFAACVRAVRDRTRADVEVLVPDFQGRRSSLELLLDSRPICLAHNVETVPELYRTARPGSFYPRSLSVLAMSKEIAPDIATKSNIMLGLGETRDGVRRVLEDLRGVGCDGLTIGQYLAPSKGHLPVREYVHPDTFREYGEQARSLGFSFVASGPLVRSSYKADEQFHGLPVS